MPVAVTHRAIGRSEVFAAHAVAVWTLAEMLHALAPEWREQK